MKERGRGEEERVKERGREGGRKRAREGGCPQEEDKEVDEGGGAQGESESGGPHPKCQQRGFLNYIQNLHRPSSWSHDSRWSQALPLVT